MSGEIVRADFDFVPLVEGFNGKNRIACAFREVARGIAKRNGLCADVDEILFVIDEAREKQANSASEIFRIPPLWQDVLFQLTLKRFRFAIKFTNVNLEAISGDGKVFSALVYHELRHIKKNSKTGELYLDKTHDVEDWRELLPFGDWEHDSECAKLLPNFSDTRRESF